MTTKTLKDAIEAKLKLQGDILRLVQEFETEYDISVSEIRVDSGNHISENRCFAWRVEVRVEV